MMGGSCSRLQDHSDGRGEHSNHQQQHHHQQQRRGVTRGGSDNSRSRRGGGFRSRSFSSAVGRLCGGSQDGSSDEESSVSVKVVTKRAARHSVDAEVPNQSISHFYPTDDNYQPHPTNPSLRCPKSLTDLSVDCICRALPDLQGGLPPNLPQDIVDRIVQSLTSHAALNSTTLRALSKCELGSLSLANCRGVSDEWLASLGSGIVSSDCSPNMNEQHRLRSESNASSKYFLKTMTDSLGAGVVPSSPPLRSIHPTQFAVPSNSNRFLGVGSASSMMMDLDDYEDFHSGENLPLLPPPAAARAQQGQEEDGSQNPDNTNMEDCCAKSVESRSTSSFHSACEEYRPSSPLLPSVLPPPEFFSVKWSPMAPSSSSLWLYPLADHENRSNLMVPSLTPHQKPSSSTADANSMHTDNSLYNNETTSFARSHSASTSNSVTATSTLTLLDLRGSQRLTDRGLLQLSHAPLRSLEVAKLDNCHGITGRGLLAFSKSYRLHTLSLANCRRLTDEAVVNVSHLGASLVFLNLGGCRCLTDRSLDALEGLLGLRKLDLSQCDLITDNGLANLNNLELLEELSLGWCRLISDNGIALLAEQPHRSRSLRTLRLARCSITDEGCEFIAKLEHLEELDLNGCIQVSSTALGDALEKLVHLTSLDVSYCPGILRTSWQGKINNLKTLELCYSGVRDSHLSRLRSLPMLEELNLDSCLVGDWGMAHLVDNNVMPNLTMLDLADTDISDAAMSKIARFEHMKHLSLFYCNISNRGLRHLASMKNLEVLNLDSREIDDIGIRYLRLLPLKTLDLFSSRVTDLGCAYLSKIKTLTSLELCGGGVGDLGCAHLATLADLTSLNLSQNESITNRGAASLAALSNLKALNLSNTCVSSNALKFFGGLRNLQSLALYGCKDMEDDSPGLNSLQSELPSLRCLRLNAASNEDGVIDHNVESEGGEEDDDDEDEDYYEEVDDEEQVAGDASGIGHIYRQLDNEDDDSMSGSSEEDSDSMSDFQDANEVQSVDTSEGGNMDDDL